MSTPETHAVQARYARRDNGADAQRYSLYANAAALQAQQERLRAMACLWRLHGWASLADRPLLEVGCGTGSQTLAIARRNPGIRITAVDRSGTGTVFLKAETLALDGDPVLAGAQRPAK